MAKLSPTHLPSRCLLHDMQQRGRHQLFVWDSWKHEGVRELVLMLALSVGDFACDVCLYIGFKFWYVRARRRGVVAAPSPVESALEGWRRVRNCWRSLYTCILSMRSK